MKDLTSLLNSFGLECYENRGTLFIPFSSTQKVEDLFKMLGLSVTFGSPLRASYGAVKQGQVVTVSFGNVELAKKVAAFWKRNFGRGTYHMSEWPNQVIVEKCKSMGIRTSPGDNFWDMYKAYISVVASETFLAEGSILSFVLEDEAVAEAANASGNDSSESEVEDECA